MRRDARYRANYSGLQYAGGGSLADIGSAIIGGGLKQDEKNLAQAAKNKAFTLEEKKHDLNNAKFENTKEVYKDAKMDLDKKESAKEAEKKSNINSMRKFLNENYKIDTAQMSDDEVFYNGERLENIYKDKTSRQTPKFFSTSAGVVAVYNDENGKPVTKVVFDAPTKENKEKRAKTENYIQLPEHISGAVSDSFSSKTSFEDIGGTWVSKDEWANYELANKIGSKEIK